MYLLDDLFNNMRLMEKFIISFMDMRITCVDFKREVEIFDREVKDDDGVIGIVLTKDMLLDSTYMYCLEVIHSLFDKKQMEVVTALVGIEERELPQRVKWLFNTHLTVVKSEQDKELFCYCCAGKILRRMHLQNKNIV